MPTITSYSLRTARLQSDGPVSLRERLNRDNGLSFNIQASQSLEDIKVSLNSKRRSNTVEIASAEKAIEAADQPNPLRDMLKQFTKITKTLRSLKDELSKADAGTERYSQLQTEYFATIAEYSRIKEGSDFKRLLEVNQNVTRVFNSGSRPEDIYRALLSERGLVGDDYLSRVASGDTGALKLFSDNLSILSSITSANLLEDPDALDQIDAAVGAALQSLVGPQVTPTAKVELETTKTTNRLEPPKLAQIQFGSTSGLGIGLQTFLGSDAIQAALAHVPLDPQLALRLIYNPDEEHGKDKLKEHERRKDLERFSDIELEHSSLPVKNSDGDERETSSSEEVSGDSGSEQVGRD